jgi:hypothetical protein
MVQDLIRTSCMKIILRTACAHKTALLADKENGVSQNTNSCYLFSISTPVLCVSLKDRSQERSGSNK